VPARWTEKLLALALIPSALSSCVFLLGDRPTAEEHCSFQGDSFGPCHGCIADECQAEVDACCGDEACSRDLLASLDACATDGHGQACTELVAAHGDTSPSSALSACVKQRCGALCVAGESQTRCSVSSDSTSCDCWTDEPFDGTPCDNKVIDNPLCCADSAWPRSGSECTCERFSCDTTLEDCFCSTGQGQAASSCGGEVCCSSSASQSCSCGSRDCSSTETYVGTSCSVDLMECPAGKRRVKACSLLSD